MFCSVQGCRLCQKVHATTALLQGAVGHVPASVLGLACGLGMERALRRIIAYDSAAPDCLLRPARVCRGVFITYNVLQAALPWLVPSQPAAEEFLHSQVCLPAWRITGKSGCAR